ncbi:uncharacterized protein LOC134203492 [Armigeres subalbatus]|uniref:uncharacterized protein LOC134203492 n=1 Tax=Armigeres subalbatus TaxID=124917 RepID=UPI002ED487C1
MTCGLHLCAVRSGSGVPGGGVESNEESSLTASRDVLKEAGIIGELDRCLGIFENSDRTEVFVMVVTQKLDEWEDFKTIGLTSFKKSSLTQNCIHVTTDVADDKLEWVPTSAMTKSPPPQPPLTDEDGTTSIETEDQPVADSD